MFIHFLKAKLQEDSIFCIIQPVLLWVFGIVLETTEAPLSHYE
jgi:hypothetical protein